MFGFVRFLFFPFVILLLGLSSCEDDELIPFLTITISGEDRYGDGEKVSFTPEVTGGVGSYSVQWMVDGKVVETSSDTLIVGPYSLTDRGHTIIAIVTEGIASSSDTLFIRPDISVVDFNGQLSVEGTHIVNEHGEVVQLRGMSTHGLQYFNSFYTDSLIKSLSYEWRADIIRLSSYVNEGGWDDGGNYLHQPEFWKKRIDELVALGEKYGLYVLIDWHMLTPGDPNFFLTEAKDFWTDMAQKHGGSKNVLFDIANEPNNEGWVSWRQNDKGEWVQDSVIVEGKDVTWPIIKEYADVIVPIIRAQSENIIIVGTPQWASQPDAVIGDPVKSSNIMYTMHFYAANHKESYRNNVRRALAAKIPVFVTEFGTQHADGDNGTDRYEDDGGPSGNDFIESQKWMDFLSDNQISWINWNLSDDFRSGAVYKEDQYFVTTQDYADSSKLKEAGQWIFDKIRNR